MKQFGLKEICKARERGFTLLELLVLFALFAILAGAGITAVVGNIGNDDKEARDVELKIVMAAVKAARGHDSGILRGVVEYEDKVIIANGSMPVNDPARYLSETTRYKYTIMSDGTVEQGSKGQEN
jgi:type II secretory pathway pseudopilin PulG